MRKEWTIRSWTQDLGVRVELTNSSKKDTTLGLKLIMKRKGSSKQAYKQLKHFDFMELLNVREKNLKLL